MTLMTVVETPEFQKRARAIMSEQERMDLIDFVARHPTAGVSIGGGVRKFRFAREGGGKSSGFRVIYFFSPEDGTPVFLITAFAKNEKANLTKKETELVKTLGQSISAAYRSKR